MTEPARRTPLRPRAFTVSRPARRRGLLDRLLKRPRPDLAAHALRALFAGRDPAAVSATEISNLLLHYGVIGAEGRELLVQTWRQALATFLDDDALTEAEVAYLGALRAALGLTADEIKRVEQQVLHPRYELAVRDALHDRRLTVEEWESLTTLASRLGLPADVERGIFERSASEVLADVVRESVADRRLSPEEREQLRLISRQLGVDPTLDTATRAMLDRFALFWRIENGDRPEVPVPMPLGAGERCHFAVPAAWYGERRAAEHGDEGVGRVRVARGVYYRTASVSAERMERERLVPIDGGQLYITNERVLLVGPRGERSIPLRSVRAFEVYADGLALTLDEGAGPYVILDGDVELAAVILGASLARPT